jgi:hypothetical protein
MADGTKHISKVTVLTIVKELVPNRSFRNKVEFYNYGPNTVYLGLDDVDVYKGFPVPSGSSYHEESSSDNWYGISQTSANVLVVETL